MPRQTAGDQRLADLLRPFVGHHVAINADSAMKFDVSLLLAVEADYFTVLQPPGEWTFPYGSVKSIVRFGEGREFRHGGLRASLGIIVDHLVVYEEKGGPRLWVGFATQLG
jgi:hypothetical protein